MSDEGALSIGEVLGVLQEEFPDCTISKIRFLESQGLVRPERNASGYRQFSELDVERLRWILRQQRDHFLPLKVIKKALDRGVDVHDAGDGDQPTLWSSVADAAVADEAERERRRTAAAERPAHPSNGMARTARPAAGAPGDPSVTQDPPGTPPPAAASSSASAGPAPSAGGDADAERASRRRHATPADVVAALQEDPRTPAGATGGPRPAPPRATRPVLPPTTATDEEVVTRDELLGACGGDEALLAGLEDFGLLLPVLDAGEPVYSSIDREVADAARELVALGLQPRHLRAHKVAAEREAGLIEQAIMPLLKQRNPASRAKAAEAAEQLATLGGRVHAALLARQLGPQLRR